MKQLLALVVSASFLTPSIALAAGEESSKDNPLTLSGKYTEAAMIEVMRSRSQSSSQQSKKDETLLGMHPALTITLFTAGGGAALGAFVGDRKDAQGNPLPKTAGWRARNALIGASVLTGIFWLAALSQR